jgi:thiol-disulfide isomerase/thioredoxin
MERKRGIRTGLEWTALALLAVLVLHRFLPSKAAAPTTANARTFTLTGIDGNPIPESVYEGKALLLNFWAPWCPPCRMEIPWLQKLQNEERGKIVVIGVVSSSAR